MASQFYALRWRCAFLALFGGLAVAAAPMSTQAKGPAEADEFVMSGGFDEDASVYAAHAVHDAPPAGVGSGSILGVDYEESYSGNWDESYNAGCCDSGCCDSGCCDDVGCASCAGGGRKCPGFWVGGEYLLWRLSGTALPPLVTQSPATTPLNEAGRLNDPNTTIIGGNNVVGGDWRSGYRLFAGVWLDPCQKWALSGDYFSAGSDDYDFTSTPSASTIVTRPYFNSQTGEDDVQFVSIPNQLDGTAQVSAGDSFQGAGLTLQHCYYSCCDPCGCGPSTSVGLLGGYRYYEYDSNLTVTENLLVLPGTTQPFVPGTTFLVQDSFTARNQFHGGEVGLQARRIYGNFWWDGTAKIAIGTNRRTVRVNGQTVTTVPNGGTDVAAGGLLTSEFTNIGQYTDSSTVVIPDFRLGVGAMLTNHWSVRAGYRVIIWADVARAADHLPPGLAVDPRNIPPVQSGGGPEPIFPGIQGTQLVAHGFDLGVQFTY
jgi:hypothetical protein